MATHVVSCKKDYTLYRVPIEYVSLGRVRFWVLGSGVGFRATLNPGPLKGAGMKSHELCRKNGVDLEVL